jgi:hypothetical protein
MECPMIAIGLAILTVLLAGPARADMAASAACAARLAPLALKIYHEAGPNLKPDTSITDLVRNVIRPMVASGKLGVADAKQAAEAAAVCLKARFS